MGHPAHLETLETMNRREKLKQLPLSARLEALRRGVLNASEIADAVSEFGIDNFIETRSDVEKLLDYPDPIVRYNSISALVFEWGGTDRVDRLIEILHADRDPDCRRVAAGALGSQFRATRNVAIARHLSNIAANKTEEDSVRISAYAGLLDVIGVPRTERPWLDEMSLQDINWDVVEKWKNL